MQFIKKQLKDLRKQIKKPILSLKRDKQALIIPRKNNNNSTQRKKSTVINKDPELMAFYEQVFGKYVDDKNQTEPRPIKSPKAISAATVNTKAVLANSKLTENALPHKQESTAVPDRLQGLIDDLKQFKMQTKNTDLHPSQQQAVAHKIENKNDIAKTDNSYSDVDDIEDKKFT